jgi:hypothetical protein
LIDQGFLVGTRVYAPAAPDLTGVLGADTGADEFVADMDRVLHVDREVRQLAGDTIRHTN